MRLKIITLISACTYLCLSCGGSDTPAVGEGAAFSTLSTVPTGVELWTALSDAIRTSTTSARIPVTRAQTGGGSKTLTCSGGGSINLSATANITSVSNGQAQAGTLSGQGSFQDCKVTLALSGGSQTETITGSESVNDVAESGHLNISNSVKLTGSGDLGFSVDCDLTQNYTASGTEPSGSCTFRDSAGAEITAASADLGANFILVANPFDIL